MNRAERRRDERAEAKGRLTDTQIAHLEKLRREEKGSEYEKMRTLLLVLISVVRRSGVVPYLHRRLRIHNGPKSKLPIEVLVVLFLVNWHENADYLRVAIYKTMKALDAQSSHDIGLCTKTEWVHVTLNMVYKQYLRFERALEKELKLKDGKKGIGWIDETDETHCNPEWLMDKLIDATVPRQVRRKCRTYAIDETAFPTDARIADNKTQKEADELGVTPSKDKHARRGYKTPTGKNPEEFFCGYKLATVLAMPEPIWDGNPARKPAFGYRPPPLALAAKLSPAGTDPARVALETILKAEKARQAEDKGKTAKSVKRVMADRGISNGKGFVTELLLHNIRSIIDYKSDQIARPEHIHTKGRGGRTGSAIKQTGGIFSDWMPPELWVPAPREDPRNKPGPYTKRAQHWRHSLHRIDLKAKTAHFICPVHAGRLTYPGSPITPNENALEVEGPGPGKPCCNGTIAIPLEDLGQFQDIPWGTIAWRSIYRHFRAVMEGLHGALKNKGGLGPRSCRANGIAAHTIAATAALVIWNVKLAIRHGMAGPDDLVPQDAADTDRDTDCDTAPRNSRAPPSPH